MKRVGVLEDNLVPDMVKAMNLTPNDVILFTFGEIDIRCYVAVTLDHRSSLTMESLLQSWVYNYLSRIWLMPTNGARIGIMSVVPPATFESAQSVHWPVSGTDEQRALYTKTINEILRKECEQQGWLYLDVYSEYADDKGMLPLDQIYKSVHINDTTAVKNLLLSHQLI